MDNGYLQNAVKHMKKAGVQFEPGLSEAEFAAIERECGFRFPPDLRTFLAFALPSKINKDERFPRWRTHPKEAFRGTLEHALEGIKFDVQQHYETYESARQHRGFWLKQWGERPETFEDALALAEREILKQVRLIPIYAHRSMPELPHQAGNPVFSVWQTDIIYYGYDLASYLGHEFGVPVPKWAATTPRYIPFWSDVVMFNSSQPTTDQFTMVWD